MSSDVKALVKQYKGEFANVLPQILTPDRYVRVVLTALTKTPKLAQCDQASLMSALLDCASFGLEPDGRRAHLIPFGNKVQLIIDYKGLAELVMRSGLVSYIHADVVCENDTFIEKNGQVVEHSINRKEPRGEPYAVYSYVKLKDGNETYKILGKHEVEELRDKHSAGWKRDKKSSPWTTSPNAMWMKTAFRQHCKWLPLSPEVRDAVEKDDMYTSNITAQVDAPSPLEDEPTVGDGEKVQKPKPKKSKAKKVIEVEEEPVDDDLPLTGDDKLGAPSEGSITAPAPERTLDED